MFALDSDQQKKLYEWCCTLPPVAHTGAIGGRLTYQFTPTGLGTIVVVKDAISGLQIDLTDYESW